MNSITTCLIVLLDVGVVIGSIVLLRWMLKDGEEMIDLMIGKDCESANVHEQEEGECG